MLPQDSSDINKESIFHGICKEFWTQEAILSPRSYLKTTPLTEMVTTKPPRSQPQAPERGHRPGVSAVLYCVFKATWRTGHVKVWRQLGTTESKRTHPKETWNFWGKCCRLPDGPIPAPNLLLSTASKWLALSPHLPHKLCNRVLSCGEITT